MTRKPRILVVEDESAIADTILYVLYEYGILRKLGARPDSHRLHERACA